ncbi:hypothetical protein [Wolbachia endosymbiont of Encarsia formosa]|uniref:hypothetical protein n=1 Tax=Wolbachia endosymbiont of Encarsia formosa TaxID=77125 RepID=UPI0031BA6D69
MKLFLDSFYEIRENLKGKYDKLELGYQEKSRKILEFITILMLASNSISYFFIPNNQQSESAIKKFFDFIVMFSSILSLLFMLSNFMIGTKKEPIKRKIESYTEKINRIEEVTGKLAKTIVEVHNSEGYNAILEQLAKNSEGILQVKSMLDKLMHAVSLESRDKLNISSQKMNRCDSTVLAERRSSSFLGNLGEKLDQYVRRNSRVQNIMDKLDNPSCVIAINEDSESKPKTPKNKFKNVATKLKRVSIFSKKKEDLISSSSLSEGANQENITRMNEENCGLIKRFGDTNKYLIFSTPFNPSGSTSREECGNNHSAACHVSDGSANNPVSDKEVSKSPSLILSNLEEGIIVDCFKCERYRPRVYSSPSCIRKRAIITYETLPDHVERKKIQSIVPDPDIINFQRSDSKNSSKLSLSSR